MMQSIKTKLMLAIAIIMVTSIVIVAGFSYWKASDLLVNQVEDTLKIQARSLATDGASWIDQHKMYVETLANTNELKSGNEALIFDYIAREDKRLGIYGVVSTANLNGDFHSSKGARGSIKDRPYFQEALKGQTAISDVVVSRSDGQMIVAIASPIKKDNKVIGVAYVTIPITKLQELVTATKVGETGRNYIIDKSGIIIAHPDKQLVMKLNLLTGAEVDPNLKNMAAKMVKGEKGLGLYNFAGKGLIGSYTPVEGTNWTIVANIEKQELDGRLNSLIVMFTLITIGILIVSLGIVYVFTAKIIKPIGLLKAVSEQIAAGDLRVNNLEIESKDEFGQLAISFEKMIDNTANLLRNIQKSSEHLAAASEQLTASAQQSSEASSMVATAITNVAEGAHEQMNAASSTADIVSAMSTNIHQVAENSKQVAKQSNQAADKAKDGGKAVEQAVSQMSQIENTVNSSAQVVIKLGEQSKEIGQIVDTISGIASQTNLLALNAAIEAARAGEQGRGFAVVAEEVRKLAEQSQEAAKKIAELISDIQVDTERAVVAMQTGTKEVKTGAEVVNLAGGAFREIANLVVQVADQVETSSKAMDKMVAESQRIVTASEQINQISSKSAGEAQSVSAATEEQLASMEEIASSSQALAQLAQDLQQEVAKFKV